MGALTCVLGETGALTHKWRGLQESVWGQFQLLLLPKERRDVNQVPRRKGLWREAPGGRGPGWGVHLN